MATTKDGFSAAEKSAMKERSAELKAPATGPDGEADVLAKIAEMPAYAMPGRSGRVICFFQSATKLKTRYNTIGFSDTAALDEGSMWATSFAVLAWNAANEQQLRDLVHKSVSATPPD